MTDYETTKSLRTRDDYITKGKEDFAATDGKEYPNTGALARRAYYEERAASCGSWQALAYISGFNTAERAARAATELTPADVTAFTEHGNADEPFTVRVSTASGRYFWVEKATGKVSDEFFSAMFFAINDYKRQAANSTPPAGQDAIDAERLEASNKWNKAWDEKAAQQAAEVAALPKPSKGKALYTTARAVVTYKKSTDEYRVTFYDANGEKVKGATYFTDDRDDAIGTATLQTTSMLLREQAERAAQVDVDLMDDDLLDASEPTFTQITPVAVDITVTLPVDDEFCRDVICTAIEGGSNYWMRAKALERVPGTFGEDYHKVMVNEIDENTGRTVAKFIVDPDAIRAGITLVLSGKLDVHASMVGSIFTAVATKDAGQIDADIADVIFQAATLKQIVYG